MTSEQIKERMDALEKSGHLTSIGRMEVGKILLGIAHAHRTELAETKDRIESLVQQREALLEKTKDKAPKKKK